MNSSLNFFYHLYADFGFNSVNPYKPLFMRKVDIVSKIADATGVPKTDVLITLEAFFKEVKDQVKEGENVYVRGFGSFIAKKRAQKVGRIITRGESIIIPEHYIPAFKPAKVFMEQVKNGYKPGPGEGPKPPVEDEE